MDGKAFAREQMMPRIQPISLRALSLAIAGMIAGVAVLALALTAHFFRQAAFAAQHQVMSHVVSLASAETLRNLDARLFALGTGFQERAELRAALATLQRDRDAAPLLALLQDPFSYGFADMRQVDLAKLRVYDLDFRLLGQNHSALDLPSTLTPALLRRARGRQGVDALKALGALWTTGEHSFYSVLLPIGGLRISGYLEVVADPTFNLQSVATMTGMPLSILSARGNLLYQSVMPGNADSDRLEIEYALRDPTGALAFRLVSRADVSMLNSQLTHTTLVAIGVVVGLIVFSALIVGLLFNRILLRPVEAMQNEMKRCADGDLSVTVGRGMLKDFNTFADTFNAMAHQLSAKLDELLRLSHVDSLTGLANRHHFDQCIEKEWRRALRNRTPLSLLMIDVDFFKRYNDHYGHVAGDACLQAVAASIGKVVQRSTDLPARYGGEEFAVLLPGTPLESALALADELIASFAAQQLPHADSPCGRISVSIGVASCGTAETCSPAGLIRVADEALYAAKHAGRNRLAVAGPSANNGQCLGCSGFQSRPA